MRRGMVGAVILRRGEWRWFIALIVATALIWCGAFHRWTLDTWATPLTYGNDAWWGMASAKAVSEGQILPVLPKHPAAFGAPFVANWDDYPSVEEGILACTGLLARLFGVFAGSNAAVLVAQILAALAFYFVARFLRYDRRFAFSGALVFAFSRYVFSRSPAHLGLTFYWHIPLGLLLIWLCFRKAGLRRRGAFGFGIAVAVIFGIQNPYYTGMFMQLLVWAALVRVVRFGPVREAIAPLAVLAATLLTFLLMNADTFASRITNGPNPEVVQRNYAGLEFYALKPIELLIPVVHQIPALHRWARETYFAKTMLIGEAGSPYLGWIGIAALFWLAAATMRVAIRRESGRKIPSHFWLVLWVLAYSVVGGVNGLVGFVMELFRGTNRYSIVILALVLLFLVRQLTPAMLSRGLLVRIALAIAIVAIALFDQVPPALGRGIADTAHMVERDREITRAVESQLPRGAMVFQLPVVDFPEAGSIVNMTDYEHFRPFLHSHSLRYSYGSVRGRPRDAWQKEAGAQPAPRMIAMLERYGFAAIWVNRNGYQDRAAALAEQLQRAGRSDVLAENHDFICIALQPSATPTLPPEFRSGWHTIESAGDQDWRWSSGPAVLVLHNGASTAKTVRVRFQLTSIQARRVTIVASGKTLAEAELGADAVPQPVEFVTTLEPGANVFEFQTDKPGEFLTKGDPRRLAFCLRNFAVLD